MKRAIRCALTLIALTAAAQPAFADKIEVVVKDELGNAVTAVPDVTYGDEAVLRLILPGGDGTLAGFNPTVSVQDNGALDDDPVSGVIRVDCSDVGLWGSVDCGGSVQNGQSFSYVLESIETIGFVDYSASVLPAGAGAYDSSATTQSFDSANQYTIKVNFVDELGNAVTNALSAFNSGVSSAVFSGITRDDNTQVGYVYIPGPAVGTADLDISSPGFITKRIPITPSASAQNVISGTLGTQRLSYAVKVLGVTDELGNVVALADGAPSTAFSSGTASNLEAQVVSGGVGYLALAAADSVSVEVDGYVTQTVAGVSPSVSVGSSQTTVDFDSAAQYAGAYDGPGLPFAYVITSVTTETLATDITASLTGLQVGDSTGLNACVANGGAWYCPVLLANSDGTLQGKATLDGYVESALNLTAGTVRTANADAQQTDAMDGVLYSHKATTISTEALAANIAGAGTTLSIGGDACTWDAGTSTYYCAVLLANDSSATSATVTLDGYVQAAYGTVGNRTANSDAQSTDAISGVQYGHKIATVSTEALAANIAGASATVTIGGDLCAWDGGTSAFYCPVQLTNDDGGTATVTRDGYVQAAYGAVTNRTANTDAQQTDTIAGVQYGHKIATVSTETLAANIAGASATLTIGGDSCAWDSGTSAFYCPALLANDNGGTATVTRDGYVTAAYGAVANRTANTDAQQTDAISGVQYSHKATTVSTEALAANIAGAGTTLSIGGDSCTWDAGTSTYYCPVLLANDGTAAGATVTLDGYVQKAYGTVANRTAGTDAQQTDTISGVEYSHKATTVSTEALAANIAGAGTTLSIGGDSCTWDAGTSTYYCPVILANDNTATSATVTLDGYVQTTYGTVGNRTANTDAQQTDTISGVQYSHKVTTVSTETLAANIAGSSASITVGGDSCTWDSGTSAFYCPIQLANDNGGTATVTRDGYVTAAYGAVANRTANTDAQQTDAIAGIQYSHKVTTVSTQVLSANLAGAGTTLSIGGDSCTWNAGTSTYYCPVLLANDDTAAGATVTLDGYVQKAYGTVANRTAGTDAQQTDTISGVEYSHKATTVSTEALAANIAGAGTTLSIGGDSCTWDAGTSTYYCAVLLANDSAATSATVTLDGYVQTTYGTVGNRTANTDAQQTDTIAGVQYGHKITTVSTETLAANIAGSSASITVGGDSCAWDSGTSAFYCPIQLANDNGGTATVTRDGYVTAAYGAVANRTANTDAQQTDAITGIQYSHKVTTVSTQVLSANLAGAGTTLSIGGDSCTWNAGTSTYYCPVLLANDDTAAGATVTLDGYVQKAYGTVANRTAGTDAQQTDTISGVEYSHKATTVSTEALAANIAGAAATLSIGGDSCTWDAGTSTYYCPVLLANDNTAAGATVTQDGYVAAAYGTVANRTANTDAQQTDTISGVKYSHKVSSITTETLGVNIAGSSTTLSIGGDSCTWDAGTSAFYCPVLLVNDNGASSAAVTKDGYVQQAYGTVADRTANGDAQQTDSITNVQYSHKATTVSTEALAANIAGSATTLTIGGDSCIWDSGTSTYYCPVLLANDNTAAGATVTRNGYVQAAYGTVANRTANTDAQQTDTIASVQYGHKVTTISTEVLSANIAGAATTLTIGGDACSWDAGTSAYYCAVQLTNDNSSSSATVTKDGYVQQAYGAVADRTAHSGAQQTDTIASVQYSHKVTTVSTESVGANIAGAGTTLTIGGDSCMWDAGTSTYYCAVLLANDSSANSATVTLNGYVQAAYGTVNDRTANTDAQKTDTIAGVQYGHKVTTVSTEVVAANIAGSSTTLSVGGDSCTWNSGASAYFCPVQLLNDNGAVSATVTLDGYVQAAYGTVADRTANTDAQQTDAISGVQYAHKITTVTTEQLAVNIAGSSTAVAIGGASCAWDTGTSTYYCPATLSGDTAGTAAVTRDGYVDTGYGTVANRTANTDAQQIDTISSVQYSHKVTTVSTEALAANLAGAGTTLSIGGDSCTWNAGTSTYYCAVLLANDSSATSATVTLDGYVQTTYGTVGNRTANTDAQQTDTISGVKYSHKATTISTEALAANIAGAGTTLSIGGDSCTWDAGTSAYYCAVLLANDSAATSATVTLDGYVQAAYGTVGDRTASADAQQTDAISGVQYGHKITTVSTETLAANIAGSSASITIGGDSCAWDSGTSAFYCPIQLANDNGGTATVTRDGYVTAAYGAVANRTANTDAQQTDAIAAVQYSHIVTSIVTEALAANLEGAGTTLTIGGDSCAWDAGTTTYYCPVLLANDDTAAGATVTQDGYVATGYGTVANRTAGTDAQQTDSISGVQYSHKVTTVSTEALSANIAGAGTTLDIGGDACTWDAGTSAYYCAVLLANDSAATSATVTLDGYVQTTYGTVGNRTANADAQQTDTISSVQYSHKVTTVSTEALAANIAGAGTSLDIGGDACAWDAGTSAYYCAVLLANDSSATSATVTLDGYVEAAYGTVADRTANADAQQTDAITSVQYGHKITTVSTETLAANIAGSSASITIGGDSCAWDAGTSAYYCPTQLANDNGGTATVTRDGYVTAGYGAVADRTANTDGQQTDAIAAVQYSHIVTSIVTEALAANLEGAGTALSVGGDACAWDAGTTTYYCPVLLANDDAATGATVTLDGYVATGYGAVANRTAGTDAQQTDSISGVQYSHKVTTVSTEAIGTNIAGAGTTLDIGGDACTWDAGTSAYYCAVLLANDDTATGATVTLDGYVQQAYSTVNDRTTNSAIQSVDNIINVQYGHKATTISTEAVGANIAGSSASLDINGTACAWNAGAAAYYCPVPVLNDNSAVSATVTRDGYVQQAYGTVGDRANNLAAQSLDSISNIQYGHKITTINTEVLSANIAGSAAAVSIGADACAWDSGTSAFYCPALLTSDDAGTASVTRDGYVSTAYGSVADRTANTDAQQTDAIAGVQYSHVVTSITTEALAAAIEGAGTGLTIGSDACTWDAGTATYYCPALLASDDTASAASVTLDGYVTKGYGAVADRTANGDAQQTDAILGVQYSHKISFQREIDGQALTGATVNAGSGPAACSGDGAGAYYCPVLLADDGGVGDIDAALAGYVDGAADSGDRTASTSAQQTHAVTLQFRLKTTVADEFGAALSPDLIAFNGQTPDVSSGGAYYAADEGPGSIEAKLDGYLDFDVSVDVDAATATLDLTNGNGGNTAQTTFDLTGTSPCASGSFGPVAAPVTVVCDGLKYNSLFNVNDALGAGLSGLTGSNFVFRDGGGGTVAPLGFNDAGGGAYNIALPTAAAEYDIVDAGSDADPNPEFQDLLGLSLGSLSSSALNVFNPPNLQMLGDHLVLTPADGTLESGGTETISIQLLDNDNNLASVGSHATYTVTITLSGGSVSPASMKDIVATTLSGATSVSGASDLSVTGQLTGASATVTIADSVVGDGTDVLVSIAGTPALAQAGASDTVNLPIDVVPDVPAKIEIVDPADDITGATIPVTFRVLDAADNLVDTNADRFVVNVTGSAAFTGVSTGTANGGVGTQSLDVSASGGLVVADLYDETAETVTLTLTDSQALGYDLTAVEDAVFSPGPVAEFLLVAPGQNNAPVTGKTGTASTQTAGVSFNVTALAVDAFSNVVPTATDTVTLSVAETRPDATLPADTPLTAGQASIPMTLTTAQTAALSLSSLDNPGLPGDSEDITVIANAAMLDLQASPPASSTVGLTVSWFNANGHETLAYTDTSSKATRPTNNGTDSASATVVVYDVYENRVPNLPVVLTGTNLDYLSVDGAATGTAVFTKSTDASGMASFEFTTRNSGDYDLTVHENDSTGTGVGTDAFTIQFKEEDELPPTVAITSPLTGASLSGGVSIKGTVMDEHLQNYVVEYGPGTAPTLYRAIFSETVPDPFNPDAYWKNDELLTTWDTGDLNGSYVIRLTATDAFGKTSQASVSVTVSNTVGVSGTVTQHEWRLLSAPVNPTDPDPDAMFDRAFGQDYVIYRLDPDAPEDEFFGRNVRLTSAAAGYGFWIKAHDGDLSYSYQGTQDTSASYELPIKAGWNHIGPPFNRDFDFSDMRVKTSGGSVVSISQAVSDGLVEGAAWGYTPSGGFDDVAAGGALAVQKGYEIKALSDVALVFDPGAGQPDGVARVVASEPGRPYIDFKIKISASTPTQRDGSNYFGVAENSDDGYDASDLSDPPSPPDAGGVALYFDNASWGENAGRYAADYRSAPPVGLSKEWNFTVETGEAGQTTLTWDNTKLPTSAYAFTLTNLANGESVDMAAVNSYVYEPAGQAGTTQFKIVVVRKAQGETVFKFTVEPGWSLIGMPVDPAVSDALTALSDYIGAISLFEVRDGRFVGMDGVDLQAGRGYWLHVNGITTVQIVGTPLDPAEEAEVPLTAGWNLAGNPFDQTLKLGDNIIAAKNGLEKTLSEARESGWIEGDILGYDSQSGYEAVAADSDLEPWTGFFIKASEAVVLKLAH